MIFGSESSTVPFIYFKSTDRGHQEVTVVINYSYLLAQKLQRLCRCSSFKISSFIHTDNLGTSQILSQCYRHVGNFARKRVSTSWVKTKTEFNPWRVESPIIENHYSSASTQGQSTGWAAILNHRSSIYMALFMSLDHGITRLPVILTWPNSANSRASTRLIASTFPWGFKCS